jgi:hypothetical protein
MGSVEPEPHAVHGKRLLPNYIDHVAEDEPQRVLGMIARSPDISLGFQEITYEEFARAVDFCAWWLHRQLEQKDGSKTISYLVSRTYDDRWT